MANSLEEAFEKINSRPLSDSQRKRMLKIQSVLDLKDNDALMTALFALESYNGMYGEIPEKIVAAVNQVTENAKKIAQEKLQLVTADIVQQIGDKSAKAVKEIAGKQAQAEKSKWVAAAFISGAIALSVVGAGAYWIGSKEKKASYDAGYAAGQQSNLDAKALAAWSNTTEGYLAYRLYQNGTLSLIAHCSGKGWKIEDINHCVPYGNVDGKTYGWRLR